MEYVKLLDNGRYEMRRSSAMELPPNSFEITSAEYEDLVSGKNVIKDGLIVTAPPYVQPPPTQDELDIAAAKNYAKLQELKNMTPAQIQSWVNANVTNLATAQDAIKTLAIAVSILARRM